MDELNIELDNLYPGRKNSDLLNSPVLTRMNSRDLRHLETAVNIKKEIERDSNTWNSCCLTVDKRFVVFTVQSITCLSIMVFSMVMLFFKDSCDNQIYISLISTIVGLYMPSPKIKN
jgi:hypothetical protein